MLGSRRLARRGMQFLSSLLLAAAAERCTGRAFNQLKCKAPPVFKDLPDPRGNPNRQCEPRISLTLAGGGGGGFPRVVVSPGRLNPSYFGRPALLAAPAVLLVCREQGERYNITIKFQRYMK